MNMLGLIMLLLVPSAWEEILVLKNGRKMTCERYERKGKNVMVFRAGETFALPEAMIDWAKSKAAMEAASKKAEARAAKEDAARKKAKAKADQRDLGSYYAGKKKKGLVSITDQTIVDRGFSSLAEPEVIHYRTMGNTILVQVSINGSNAQDFVLDTGAAMTLVSPQLANQLGLKASGSVAVHGVGGGGAAQTAKVAGIALGKARVNNMTVAIREIPVLTQARIQGLLGQDFLNHFVMKLDSMGRTVTLSPTGGAYTPKSNEEIALAFQQMVPELERMVARVGALTQSYLGGSINPGGTKALGQFKGRLPQMTKRLREYRKMLAGLDVSNMEGAEQKRVKAMARCMHFFETALDKMGRHITLLRRVFHAGDTSFSGDVSGSWEKVSREAAQFETCMKDY